MTPGKIRGATRELRAPDGWDETKDGACDPLQVRDRGQVIESAWYPTPEERAAIDRGWPVVLTIWSAEHPPVSLNVSEPGL